MLSKVLSYGLTGIDGYPVTVEVDITKSLPGMDIVGLPDTAVKESRERVRSAISNAGYKFPSNRITVNMAPANLKKEGPIYDLPIAIGIICAQSIAKSDMLESSVFIGELSLGGELRPVKGILPMTISARNAGISRIFMPTENIGEVTCIDGIEVYPIANLKQMVDLLNDDIVITPAKKMPWEQLSRKVNRKAVDMSLIRGQNLAKRALTIAAAGSHNILMIGPPGTGKTMLARSLPGIISDLTFEESMEVTKIHSIAGALDLDGGGLMVERPFRSPHHTSSAVSLVGGGNALRPGEISLAHNGILFLDELPEFNRQVLESLRQPLEDGNVTIARASGSVNFPSKFMLVASMNPCPCGNYGSAVNECRCTPPQIRRYLGKISGPMLDRFDIHIEVDSMPYEKLTSKSKEESSEVVRDRIKVAREIQNKRYKHHKIYSNAALTTAMLNKYCKLGKQEDNLMHRMFEAMNMSARGYTRVLKVARTIADLDNCVTINTTHLTEAIQYRSLDRKYWN